MKNPIDLIIFSKNRACQSETILHSIQQNANNLFNTYLLTIAEKEWLDAYKLITDYDYKFIPRTTILKPDLLTLLYKTKSEYVSFAVDDNIVFDTCGDFNLEGVFTFSLRLGYNTIVQDHFLKTVQPPLKSVIDEGNTISWNFNDYNSTTNYGYWNALDFHIFRRAQILPLLESIEFDKPNSLEGQLFYKRNIITPPRIRSYKRSKTVSVPLNNFSGMTKSVGPTVDELNKRFLDGQRLRFKVNPEDIVGCHQNLEFYYV